MYYTYIKIFLIFFSYNYESPNHRSRRRLEELVDEKNKKTVTRNIEKKENAKIVTPTRTAATGDRTPYARMFRRTRIPVFNVSVQTVIYFSKTIAKQTSCTCSHVIIVFAYRQYGCDNISR